MAEGASSELYELVLLGGDFVGKSWLSHRYVHGMITGHICVTLGCAYDVKIVHLDDKSIKFGIWDTAGINAYDSQNVLYCIGAHAAIVVYDITDRQSFKKAMFWVEKLEEVASPDIFKALAGNKADLVSKRMVRYEEAKSYADDNGVDLFMEVSAMTGENVEDLFLTVGYNLEISTAELREIINRSNSNALDLTQRRSVKVEDTVTRLTEVKALDLSHNKLTKLPTSMCRLKKLTALNLNYNQLAHLPEVIVELSNLTHLFVNNNQLSSLPTRMENLEKLLVLDLRSNRLKRLCKDISDLKHLQKLYVEGNPLTLREITGLLLLVDESLGRISIDNAVPTEILSQGHVAKRLYEEALRDGSVNVYRGRIIFIGQARAGKTSLKKSLLGLPFDPREQSTEGIEVDPSILEVEVEQVKNWNSTGENKPSLSEFSQDISRMFAEKQYHWILSEAKEDPEQDLSREESKVKSTMDLDVQDRQTCSSHKNQCNTDENHQPMNDKFSGTTGWPRVTSQLKEVSGNLDNLKNADNFLPANNTVDDLTDDGSACSSEVSELKIDATYPPDDVIKPVNRWLEHMIREGLDAENADNNDSKVTVDLWDFAGQHLYYASHPVFLSSRAAYVLVHNLSKPLNAPAQPCVRQRKHDFVLENSNNETNLENLLSWLVSVHNMRPTREEVVDHSDGMLPYLRPPVFIVGTHADKPFEDTETMTSRIQQAISGKEYEKHVIRPFFTIDNTCQGNLSVLQRIKKSFGKHPKMSHQEGHESDTDIASVGGIHTLRTRIMDVLRQEPYMGEKIPVK